MKLSLLFLSALALSVTAPAQTISYNGFNTASGSPVATLREMAANGTNDHAVAINLPEPGFPAWSRDGKLLGLSSTEPGRPNKLSRDVYVMTGATGAITKVSRFEDAADGNGYRKYFAGAKAFSPDGRLVAATVFHSVGATLQGGSNTPHLYLFDSTGAEPPVSISTANVADGINLEGFGCDWASTNVIAWPGSCGSPHYAYGIYTGLANGTCINIIQPNVNNPAPRQLTFPIVQTNTVGGSIIKAAQVDYAPSFAPNGSTVAYVRVTRSYNGTANAYLPDQCSLRMVNINGTNDHEILRMAAGQWVSQLAWSPDGLQLLFDMGPQQIISGIPYAQAVAQTVEIHTLNLNTMVPSRVHAASAVWPAWRPAVTTPPATTLPDLSMRTVPGTNNIEISWPVTSGTAPQLQSNANLSGTWSNVTTSPVVSGGMNKVTLSRTAPRMFFRLKGQ